MTWRLTASLEPKSRPNVYVELRSEALWRLTPEVCVDRVVTLLVSAGANIQTVKPSRVDPCVDVLIRSEDYTPKLMRHFVTRARDIHPRFPDRKFSGFSIGNGGAKARLYDKPLEIAKKSKKYWMYDVWGLGESPVPTGCRIVRIEFELHREALKKLGIDEIGDLFRLKANLWAYCTKKWLMVKDGPGKQAHCRKTLPWWTIVQNGFEGAFEAHPLIRASAINEDRKQAMQQLLGQVSRLIAIDADRAQLDAGKEIDLATYLPVILQEARNMGMTSKELSERVREKQAKYERSRVTYKQAVARRASLGLTPGSGSAGNWGDTTSPQAPPDQALPKEEKGDAVP